MSSKTVSFLIFLVGVIHLLPVLGALGADRLSLLYGVTISGSDLEILMRHRAVLFGLLGIFLIVAAFQPSLQVIALIAGSISVGSFLWLAWSVGGYNDAIKRIVFADWMALAGLVVAAGLMILNRSPAAQ